MRHAQLNVVRTGGEQLVRDIKHFLTNPGAADGVRLIYNCRTHGDYTNASVVFRALVAHRRVNASVVAAFMRTCRTCGHPEEVLSLWHSLPQLGVIQDIDIAINTITACASIGSPASLKVGEQIHSQYQSNLDPVGIYLIGMYTKCGKHMQAISLWQSLVSSQSAVSAARCISPVVCTSVLTSCAQLATTYALSQGSYIHSLVRSSVLKQDVQLATILMNMYVKCQQPERALEVWAELEQSAQPITSHITCVCALTACASMGTQPALEIGKRVHSIATSFNWNQPTLFNALVAMYTKCGEPETAIQLWKQQQATQMTSIELYTSMLTTCAKIGPTALSDGIQMHSQVMASKTLQPDPQFHAALVNMYVKCGEPNAALSLWKTIESNYDGLYDKCMYLLVAVLGACAKSESDTALEIGAAIHLRAGGSISAQVSSASIVVYYTSLITMYTRCGHPERALAVYNEMLQRHIQMGSVTYTCLLTACGAVGPSALEVGRQICDAIQREGIIAEVSLENSLLSMLVKCGEPLEALTRWQALHKSLLFTPSTVSYICVLAACADIGPPAIADGIHVHSLLSKDELKQEDVTAALLNMYARCGQPLKSLELWKCFTASYDIGPVSPSSPALYTAIFTACAALRTTEALEVGLEAQSMMDRSVTLSNSITNTALIQMYSRCGDPNTALSLWSSQLHSQPLTGDGGKSDKIRIISALSVCSTLRNSAALQVGKQLAQIVDTSPRLRVDIVVLTALIGMYAHCGDAETAITLWRETISRKIRPTRVTYLSVLLAYSSIAMPAEDTMCNDVEAIIASEDILEYTTDLAVALLDNYASCGRLMQAEQFFEHLRRTRASVNVLLWNVMIKAYGVNLMATKAIHLFNMMTSTGVMPTSVTFTGLLSACAYSGCTKDAQHYYEIMPDFSITPTFDHVCCIIDGFSRHGELQQAQDFISKQGNQNIVMWKTLLGGIRSQIMRMRKMNSTEAMVAIDSEVARAEFVTEKIMQYDPKDSSTYVTLGNIYSSAMMHKKAKELHITMTKQGIYKIPGISWLVDESGVCHKFYANDRYHPRIAEVNLKWEQLSKLVNYTPDLDWVLHDESDVHKHSRLCRHSEKLALCYGLLVLPLDATIYISKNLRMCGDCHAAIALISKVLQRKIVVRDAKIFHSFEDGKCQCNGKY
eukprot:Phypoly_transcript_01144.p1 GENE.Phypoly_transcript_01144~~Phypoly_transcript_01144.p1  ORF type:complete len:1168 (+),score=70.91 Phypoly_transcript_01144:126-3629(+)